jgi:hypothetical protein
MPQIWMTYGEIAGLLGCEPDEARAQAVYRSLDRKRSRDGLTRVKLDLDWTAKFIAAVRPVRYWIGPFATCKRLAIRWPETMAGSSDGIRYPIRANSPSKACDKPGRWLARRNHEILSAVQTRAAAS